MSVSGSAEYEEPSAVGRVVEGGGTVELAGGPATTVKVDPGLVIEGAGAVDDGISPVLERLVQRQPNFH